MSVEAPLNINGKLNMRYTHADFFFIYSPCVQQSISCCSWVSRRLLAGVLREGDPAQCSCSGTKAEAKATHSHRPDSHKPNSHKPRPGSRVIIL